MAQEKEDNPYGDMGTTTTPKEINTRIKLKRDTESQWDTRNPQILDGEVALVDCADGRLRAKIGDGTSTYSALGFIDHIHVVTQDNKEEPIPENAIIIIDTTEDDLTGSVTGGGSTGAGINAKLTINGIEYDGSEAVNIDLREFAFNATMINEDTGECEIDVTALELAEAYQAGRPMVCCFNGFRLNFAQWDFDNSYMVFTLTVGVQSIMCVVQFDGPNIAARIEISEPTITINGNTWIGNTPIDFTDDINLLIEDKVKNIGLTQQDKTEIATMAKEMLKETVTLRLHTDGRLYMFIDDEPVGDGIPLPNGMPSV